VSKIHHLDSQNNVGIPQPYTASQKASTWNHRCRESLKPGISLKLT